MTAQKPQREFVFVLVPNEGSSPTAEAMRMRREKPDVTFYNGSELHRLIQSLKLTPFEALFLLSNRPPAIKDITKTFWIWARMVEQETKFTIASLLDHEKAKALLGDAVGISQVINNDLLLPSDQKADALRKMDELILDADPKQRRKVFKMMYDGMNSTESCFSIKELPVLISKDLVDLNLGLLKTFNVKACLNRLIREPLLSLCPLSLDSSLRVFNRHLGTDAVCFEQLFREVAAGADPQKAINEIFEVVNTDILTEVLSPEKEEQLSKSRRLIN